MSPPLSCLRQDDGGDMENYSCIQHMIPCLERLDDGGDMENYSCIQLMIPCQEPLDDGGDMR